MFLKISSISQENTRVGISLIKLQAETSTQVLSCEIYEIFKNTYFEEYLEHHFLQNTFGGCFCLHFLIYTFLLILICTYSSIIYLYLSYMPSLYYYMNLIKLIKYGEYRNYDEIFWIEEYSCAYCEFLRSSILRNIVKRLLLIILLLE